MVLLRGITAVHECDFIIKTYEAEILRAMFSNLDAVHSCILPNIEVNNVPSLLKKRF
jgi:hypothetical protein